MAKKPKTNPIILYLNPEGKANIAAKRTITASMPLHPGAICTAWPVEILFITSLLASTSLSNIDMIKELKVAKKLVNGRMTD